MPSGLYLQTDWQLLLLPLIKLFSSLRDYFYWYFLRLVFFFFSLIEKLAYDRRQQAFLLFTYSGDERLRL